LGWHGHIERTNNEIMSKQRVTARMEGIRKRVTRDFEEDLKIIGIGICYTVARDREEWWRILLDAKVHKGKKRNNNNNNNNLGIHA
jgi:hypothetical protein